jgi:hypothetical protein
MDLSFDFVRDSTKKDSPTGATGRTPRFEVPADSDDRSQATTVPLLFRPQGLGSSRKCGPCASAIVRIFVETTFPVCSVEARAVSANTPAATAAPIDCLLISPSNGAAKRCAPHRCTLESAAKFARHLRCGGRLRLDVRKGPQRVDNAVDTAAACAAQRTGDDQRHSHWAQARGPYDSC